MRLLKILSMIMALLLILVMGTSYFVTEQMTTPAFYQHRSPDEGLRPIPNRNDPLTDFGIEYESVEFPAVDGKTLRGWFVPGSHPSAAVVTVHGGGGDRRSYLTFVPSLHAAGYSTLLFDSREQGISDGNALGMSIGYREHEDVISAIDYLTANRGFQHIAALGNSQGAISVVLAAAKDQRIGPIVAQGMATSVTDIVGSSRQVGWLPDFFIDLFVSHFYLRIGADWEQVLSHSPTPLEVIHQIAPRPIFIIHGEQDQMIPVELAQQNFEAAGEPKELWIVEDAGHRGLRDSAGENYERKVIAFLKRELPAE